MAYFFILQAALNEEQRIRERKEEELRILDRQMRRKFKKSALLRGTFGYNRRGNIVSVVFHFSDKTILEHRSYLHACRAHYRRVLERYHCFDERLQREYYG